MNRIIARRKLESLASLFTGELNRSYLRLIRGIRDEVVIARVARLIEQGNVAGAIDDILRASGRPTAALRAALGRGYTQAANSYMRTTVPSLLRTTFTPGSRAAARVFGELDLQLIGPISRGFEEGLRAAVGAGLLRGAHPIAIARVARDSVGFTSYDISLIESFRTKLLSGDYRAALASALRDGRFDPTLERAARGEIELTIEQIDKMSTRYMEGLEKLRAETWSRTAALQATRASQYASWAQSADDAGVDKSTMTKTWVATLDDRVRDEHAEANGLTVAFDELFPVDGGVLIPGEGVYNCRCTMIVNVLPSKARRAGIFADVSRPIRQVARAS